MSRNGFLLSVCIGAVTLHACSKSELPAPGAGNESPVPAASSPTPAATVPEASAAPDAPAESSLALKRGTLTLASNQATFQPCGAQAMLWVVDQTDGVLRHAFSGQSMPLDLYIEAYGERTASVPDTEAARGYTGTFILEEVLYATPPADAPGCKEPPPTFIVAARGNEPFWAIEVTSDKMTWRQPDQEINVAEPQSQDSEGTVGYTGESGGHKLELYVEGEACRDSMSGAFSAYSARAVLDGKEFKGCARIGE